MKSKVAIIRCSDYDEEKVYTAVKHGVELLGGLHCFVKKNETILLKPNVLVGTSPKRAVTTHPSVFNAIIKLLIENNIKVIYGDSPGHEWEKNWIGALKPSGLKQVADRHNIPMGDFSEGKRIDFPEGIGWNKFNLANACFQSDGIISLPKMKSHLYTGVTGAVKNQFGCIFEKKNKFHVMAKDTSHFCKILVDINRYLKPRLFIMDGIIAMEGNGPQSGDPINMNCIIISNDPIAVDSTFCRMIDLKPEYVPTNIFGMLEGLGTYKLSEIEYVGEHYTNFLNKNFVVSRNPVTKQGFIPFFEPKPVINSNLCTKCGVCVNTCPVEEKALSFKSEKKIQVPSFDYKKCIRCFCCQEMCPHRAITIEKKTLKSLFKRK